MLFLLFEGLLDMLLTIVSGLWPHALVEGACQLFAELTHRKSA